MYPLRIYFFSSCTDVLTPTRSVLLFVVLATGDFLLNNRDLFLVKESIVIETGTLILCYFVMWQINFMLKSEVSTSAYTGKAYF